MHAESVHKNDEPLCSSLTRRLARWKVLGKSAAWRAGAAAEFQAVLEACPTDAAAANNLAVCRLHACDLPGAVMGIEAAVKADPGSHLREVVLTNLCASHAIG